jgi:hypothetical protein
MKFGEGSTCRQKAAPDLSAAAFRLSEGSSENKTAAIAGGRFYGAKRALRKEQPS